jgi:16S rRNA (uracil1498-N3)-methyltransferase
VRNTRVFVDIPLSEGSLIQLPPDSAHHVSRVLRLRQGDALALFNGRGGEFAGRIESMDKAKVSVRTAAHAEIERESPLEVILAQGISRGERMDYTLQKAVELGISAFVPVTTQRSVVQLDTDRAVKRLEHWRKIIIGACEQCGRNRLPALEPIHTLPEWLTREQTGERFILDPGAEENSLLQASPGRVILLAGPEGGFSEEERRAVKQAGYRGLRLGPRILRTETAALAAISALQFRWGDWGS